MKTQLLSLATIAIAVTACSAPLILRENVADRIASPVWMVKRPVDTGDFVLRASQRSACLNALHSPRAGNCQSPQGSLGNLF